jgi:hypothetical protein
MAAVAGNGSNLEAGIVPGPAQGGNQGQGEDRDGTQKFFSETPRKI